jgi:2-iminobutanoate/2-iminopropanoate deaminase
MPREVVRTDLAPSSPFFSQAVRGAGLVFVSGQGPFDPATGEVAGPSIQEQTRQCLINIEAILTAAGSGLDRVVSATVILAEEEDFAGMNEEWARWFPTDPPARQGARLPVRPAGMRISVAVIATA